MAFSLQLLKSRPAFTLAELLIALAILGIIATFSIPKLLTVQQDTKTIAITKEDFSAVSAAYDLYKQEKSPTSGTAITEITPYMNYVSIDTASLVDGSFNDSPSYACGPAYLCLKMHNGSIIALSRLSTFGGTSPLHMTWFLVDPDGTYTGSTKSIWGVLYFNARISTWGRMTPGSINSGGVWNPGNYDPPWFTW